MYTSRLRLFSDQRCTDVTFTQYLKKELRRREKNFETVCICVYDHDHGRVTRKRVSLTILVDYSRLAERTGENL